jgi:hypothetical protein
MEEVRLSVLGELGRTSYRSPPQGTARADPRLHEVADTQ